MSIIKSLRRPIIQAPIGSAASVELAAAVSNAGGMSTLAMTWSSPEEAITQIESLRAQTNGVFAVNFVLSFEPKALEAVLRTKVPAVTFSWGLDADLINKCHAMGTEVGVQVGSLAGAFKAIEQGADFLICQGVEAGGHVQSTQKLINLVKSISKEMPDVPLAAAGGLTDRGDVATILECGADAAVLGTRFVASEESRAHPLYKEAIVASSQDDTSFTWCFDKGWPYSGHRVLRNETLDNWEALGCPSAGNRPGEEDLIATTVKQWEIPRYHMASPVDTTTGDVINLALYAGVGSAKIEKIMSVQEIFKHICPDK
jgi:nitronate monooxygenase